MVLLDQLKQKENQIPALLGAACALPCLLLFPGNMLIPAIVLLLVTLLVFRKKIEKAWNSGKEANC